MNPNSALVSQWTKESEFGTRPSSFQDYRVAKSNYPPLRSFFRRPSPENPLEDEFISQSCLHSRRRVCFLCGVRPLSPWTCLGGGYVTIWFAALFRESIPLALCEFCFRYHFLEENPREIIPIGIAIVPDFHCTLEQKLIQNRRLLELKTLHKGKDCFPLSVDQVKELGENELFPAIHIASHNGHVQILYSFAPTVGFQVKWISQNVRMEISLPSNWMISRSMQDFQWLRSHLVKTNDFVYPLSLTCASEYLLTQFLTTCCLNTKLNQHPALHAFFSASFPFTKVAIDIDGDSMCTSFTNIFERRNSAINVQEEERGLRTFTSDVQAKVNKLIMSQHDLHQALFSSPLVAEMSSHWMNPSPLDYQQSGLEELIKTQISAANAQVQSWQRVLDFLSA